MHQPHSQDSSRPARWGIILLIVLTATGVFISSADIIELEVATSTSQRLSVDETTYYEYVAPRLDRLVVEMDDVSKMVTERSRDVVALSVSGNRIERLSSEIRAFGEANGVPERFSSPHQQITDGAEIATFAFGKARSALARFDFSAMPTLLTNFNEAADTLHAAQDELMAIVGAEARVPTQQRRTGEIGSKRHLRLMTPHLRNTNIGGQIYEI